ncbi:MAG: amylo-alpha-1,6-glucosidase, partial [Bacteroidales bacterium]|nr:amylo-alpha-1,6-glucosidase [Bacteroidales bacterium]
TIVGCNTRKYHGLLIAHQPSVDNDYHVLLSSLDISVIQHGAEFNLGIHSYGENIFNPKGHKYVRDFESDPIPKLTYRVGGVVLTSERLFVSDDDRILVMLTLEDANSPTRIRIKPYLAFRNRHELSSENPDVNMQAGFVANGISVKLYEPYSELFMQLSKKNKFLGDPKWYYGIEYAKEKEHGYDYSEDLIVPGFFEFPVKKGESVVFSAGLNEILPASLKRVYKSERNIRVPRNSFEHCLENSAQQFINRTENRTEIIAGYPWLGSAGRDTFISLPGLLLTQNDIDTYEEVLETMISDMNGPFFPDKTESGHKIYESADTSLWFCYALQKLAEFTSNPGYIAEKYWSVFKLILQSYKNGTSFGIHATPDHLLYAGEEGKPLTWMNVISDGIPFTQRKGLAVEVNALWYNAVVFALEIAKKADDTEFHNEWKDLPEQIRSSFVETFWDETVGYLADYIDDDYKDFSVRPNMLFATSLANSPLTDEMKISVLTIIDKELLTPRGLRSLSPKNLDYKGNYQGNQQERDHCYHQGTAFPWLLGHYAEGYLKLHEKSGISFIKRLYYGFEEEMTEHGIGTISEVFDGDPPHEARGCISQAWSIAELLRIRSLLNKYES